MTWVKVCGLRTVDDVDVAVDEGADAVGFVLDPASPRFVTPAQARKLGQGAPVIRVAVTVGLEASELLAAAARAGVDGVQPHGEGSARAARAAAAAGLLVLHPVAVTDVVDFGHVPDNEIPLLDAYDPDRHGGTGRTFDWDLIPASGRRFVLAGGLNPDNVVDAVTRVQPWGVDASSGLEASPGVKDPDKVAAFVRRAKDT